MVSPVHGIMPLSGRKSTYPSCSDSPSQLSWESGTCTFALGTNERGIAIASRASAGSAGHTAVRRPEDGERGLFYRPSPPRLNGLGNLGHVFLRQTLMQRQRHLLGVEKRGAEQVRPLAAEHRVPVNPPIND
jgi:hypothetical protein